MKCISILLTFVLLVGWLTDAYAADDVDSSGASTLQGGIGAFGVLSDQMQVKMGFTCVTNVDEDVHVSAVKAGTPAFVSGLHVGDHVIDAQLRGDSLVITIERKGQVFDARLRDVKIPEKPPVLVAQKAKLDIVPTKSFNLRLQQIATMPDNQLIPEKPNIAAVRRESTGAGAFSLGIEKNVQLLAKFQLQLLIDRSSSMRRPDCPDSLSRWNWVGQQAEDISKALAPYDPSGLTIIPFATEYDVFQHAKPKDISYLFDNIGLQGGTRLFEPLAERLDDYFAHFKPGDKPLLIVVITDGVPSPKFEPELVRQTLIDASKRMTNPQQVTVVFFQVGANDRFGQRFLSELDQNLVDQGARYHFVHTLLFEDFVDQGLGSALVAAIKQYAPQAQPAVAKVPPPRAAKTVSTTTKSKLTAQPQSKSTFARSKN